MRNRLHLVIWAILFMILLALTTAMIGRPARGEGGKHELARSRCAETQGRKKTRCKDWGWRVFDIGTVSPLHQ